MGRISRVMLTRGHYDTRQRAHMAASEGPNVVIQMIAWCQHPVSVYPCTVSCSVVNKHYLCFQSVIDYIVYRLYGISSIGMRLATILLVICIYCTTLTTSGVIKQT